STGTITITAAANPGNFQNGGPQTSKAFILAPAGATLIDASAVITGTADFFNVTHTCPATSPSPSPSPSKSKSPSPSPSVSKSVSPSPARSESRSPPPPPSRSESKSPSPPPSVGEPTAPPVTTAPPSGAAPTGGGGSYGWSAMGVGTLVFASLAGFALIGL